MVLKILLDIRLYPIQNLLLKDVNAAFDGDPAAKTKEEIIFCYPGLFAIFVYRFAHELYNMKEIKTETYLNYNFRRLLVKQQKS